MHKNRLLFALIFLLVLSGCGLAPELRGLAPELRGLAGDPLKGTSWVLQSYNGTQPLPGTRITAQFKDGQVGGSSGCNQYGGSYTVKGSRVAFKDMNMTMMACLDPAGAMEQEGAYLGLLGGAQSFELDGDQLVITSADGGRLVFVKAGTE